MRAHLLTVKPDEAFDGGGYLVISSFDGMTVSITADDQLSTVFLKGDAEKLIKTARKRSYPKKIEIPVKIAAQLQTCTELTQGMREPIEAEIIQYFKEHDGIYEFLKHGFIKKPLENETGDE